MKTTGIILIILSLLSFIGCATSGLKFRGPCLLLAIGVYLVYRANANKEEKN